jgi:hypothetical protein
MEVPRRSLVFTHFLPLVTPDQLVGLVREDNCSKQKAANRQRKLCGGVRQTAGRRLEGLGGRAHDYTVIRIRRTLRSPMIREQFVEFQTTGRNATEIGNLDNLVKHFELYNV